MIAEILSTGDEVRTGAVVDSNAAFIAQSLEADGLEVARHLCVGDDVAVIAAVLNEMSSRAAVAVVTGGLGPTADDVTAAAAARAAGVGLAVDAAAMAVVDRFFARRGRAVTETNRKQGLLPVGAVCLDNCLGSAPGFAFDLGSCRIYCLPGVPAEMRAMLSKAVLPDMHLRFGKVLAPRRVRVITTFGLPESAVGDRLDGFQNVFQGIKIGWRAHFPEIHVRLYLSGTDPVGLNRCEQAAVEWVVERLDRFVVSADGQSLAETVGGALIGQEAGLAVAESCTGGLIASWLTDVAGSSAYFRLGAVTYADATKQTVLGVGADTLASYGAVSLQTVIQMAEGVRRSAEATYGLATSGIAGPTGGSLQKPVGSICIGIATPQGAEAVAYRFGHNQRRTNKAVFAATALNLLRIVLAQGLGPDLAEQARPAYADRLVTDAGTPSASGEASG